MTPGQQFDLNSFLAPYGFSGDDLYVFLAAIATFFTVIIVGRSFIQRNSFASRIKLLNERRQALKDEISAPKHRNKINQETVDTLRALLMRFNLLKKSQTSNIAQFLTAAGIRNKDAVVIYVFFQLVTPIVASILCLLVVDLDTAMKWSYPLGAFYISSKLPSIYIDRVRGKRYHAIQRALADTLDLLMICAEAGLSLAQGLDRVARELKYAYPEMADELSLTSIELSFQPDRQKTLNNLAQRVKLQEVKGIVNVLIQTEKYGTPVAQALRTLAAEFRTQRMLRAEQKAARLPAIMTIPMILFILPTLFIVVIAPAVISLSDTMK